MLRHFVAYSSEVYTDVIVHNARVSLPVRYILTKMGQPHPSTLIKTDNSTANLFVHDNITLLDWRKWESSQISKGIWDSIQIPKIQRSAGLTS